MKTTTKLAVSSLKAGKTRSILTGFAIFLTTALITVIAFGCSALIREQKTSAADTYGEHFGTFSRITPEQNERVRLHSKFYNVGAQTYVGEGICKGYDMSLFTMDRITVMLSHFNIESGSYPNTEQEILSQRGFFQAYGYENPKIGDLVTIPCRINGTGKIQNKTFTISGFLPSSKTNALAKKYSAYVSEAFLDACIPDENERLVFLNFQIQNEENLNSAQMKQEIYSLAKELDIPENHVNINTGYLTWSLDPDMETIIPSICIILIIMIVSALVIYNIFNMAAIQKLREYGRLKAIGADQKQLKSIIRLEGALLSLISIPAGILFGSLLLKLWLVNYLKTAVSAFSLPLTAAVALLSFSTVALSMRRPVRLAAKTSPVEAMRYEAGGRETLRKGRKDIRILSLTLSNLSLHRKRTVTTILTMGLSCVLFVIIANIAGNMDAWPQARENIEYGRFRIEIDASLHDNAYPENNMNEIQKQAPFDEAFQKRLKEIPGVTEIRTRKVLPVCEKKQNQQGESYITVAVVNEEDFTWLKNHAEQGVVDYKQTEEAGGVIYMWDHFFDDEYKLGDLYQCEILDGDRRVPFSGPILGTCGHSNDAEITMTEATFETLGIQEDMTSILFVDCDPDREEEIKNQLEQIVDSMENISMESMQNELELLNYQIVFMKSSCYSLLIILSMIGFMNMANTMITSIVTRKREFGILQAIGMTNRQLNQMLLLEGLVFTAGTVTIALILGNIFGYIAFDFCRENGVVGLFEYHLPLPELIFFVLGIAFLQGILAFILSKNIKKESLVERIRQEE